MPGGSALAIGLAASAETDAALTTPFISIDATTGTWLGGARAHDARADDAFSGWTWNQGELTIRTDPFGLVPMFVYTSTSAVCVSTSLERLSVEAQGLTYDWPALAVFLRLGFFIGDDTPFCEVRAVPPAAHLVWRGGRWSGSGSIEIVEPRHVARTDAVRESSRLAEQAIDRRVPRADYILPLSGGRDSRHILFGLVSRGYRPTRVVTTPRYPPTPDEDPRVAAMVADALGVPHRIPARGQRVSAAEARKNVAASYCADEHAWFYPMLDDVRGDAAVLYEGIGGSLWTTGWLPDRRWRELWAAGDLRPVAEAMLNRYGVVTDAVIDRLVANSERCNRAVAIERLVPELARHQAAPDPGKSFHFWNRLRRELAIVPNGWMRQSAAVHTPLVDRDLVHYLLSLDPDVISPGLSRSDRSFHDASLHHAYPRWSRLPFESDDAPTRDPSHHHATLVRDVAAYLLGRPGLMRLVRRRYAVPRLARALVDARYAASVPWLATNALYLTQLADAAARASTAPRLTDEHRPLPSDGDARRVYCQTPVPCENYPDFDRSA